MLNFTLFLRWFLIPGAVVAVGVALVGIIAVITTQEMTATELLYELRPGNADTRRWQAAYGLSSVIIARRDELPPGFTEQVIRYLDDAIDDPRGDPRFRQFLALALLSLGDRRAVPVLAKVVERDEDKPTRISAMRALSEIATVEDDLSAAIVRMLHDTDPGARKVAAYAAGKIGGPETLGPLRAALEDPTTDVRWNAALSLAQHQDATGGAQLARMLDRAYVREVSNLDWESESTVVKSAVIGLTHLGGAGYTEQLVRAANQDEDPEVRQLAGEALQRSAGPSQQ